MRKKKVFFHSNFHKAFTGFGKNCKNILSYLYSTGKYEIVEYATGLPENPPEKAITPWKLKGVIPSDRSLVSQWSSDNVKKRSMSYGSALIDKAIIEEKPDIYIGAEDIWAFSGYWDKLWWNKPTCAIWTTIDSLPILPEALDAASKIDNYFVWSSFAEKEFSRLGHKHVKTIRGSISTEDFYPLDDSSKLELRSSFNISRDCFIIGFVFRNQLRKSVPNLLEGFKLFKDRNPSSPTKLLLHTSWSEGWDIPRLLKEKSIDNSDVLTTYFCDKCSSFEIKSFNGQQLDCKKCGSKKSQNTTSIKAGVNERQLNQIYNLMDVYCHPFTSGGQEIPIQEAKLTNLITLVTNYSCGEDLCTPDSGGLPLEWSEYREPGTQFIKATTSSDSICRNLESVNNMSSHNRKIIGERARNWVLNNFSTQIVGSQIEKFIDDSPFCDFDFKFNQEKRDPNYSPPEIDDNGDWIVDIYKNILKMEVDKNDEGYKNWINSLDQGNSRDKILKFFKDTAIKENSSLTEEKEDLSDLIDDDSEKRLIIVIPKSIGDVYMSTSLLPSLSKVYPDYAIYYATEKTNFPVLNGNPYVHKVIEYKPEFDNLLFLEGSGSNPGYFDIAFLPTIGTQKVFNYQHNGEDIIEFDICT